VRVVVGVRHLHECGALFEQATGEQTMAAEVVLAVSLDIFRGSFETSNTSRCRMSCCSCSNEYVNASVTAVRRRLRNSR
jgi:hypothetical protein